jgi:hypothetical protein
MSRIRDAALAAAVAVPTVLAACAPEADSWRRYAEMKRKARQDRIVKEAAGHAVHGLI